MTAPVRNPREGLRTATSIDHARMDGMFQGGLASNDDYHVYLLGLHALLRHAERALADAALAAGWRRWPQADRVRWLQCDLAWHGLEPFAEAPLPRIEGDAAAAGLLYVIEGSALGARLLVRDAARLGYGAGAGADFLCRHAGDGSARRWRDFVAALEAAHFDADDTCAMHASAAATFARAEAGFLRARARYGERSVWTA